MRMRWWALTLSLISGFEGLRQAAYLDPVGVPTICFGHTQGVMLGDTKTLEECHDLLAEEAEYFAEVVYYSTDYRLSDEEYAAYVSFTYNVGAANWKSSTLLKFLNSGQRLEACHQLPRWVYAKGIRLPGLVKRREQEHDLCIKGALALQYNALQAPQSRMFRRYP
ncbi:lysozyme [Neptunomonas concharum]|uniref:Lysozyme n=2 Tax=Neptunomonas concharum TaxID=1031538 RepID=A0A5P1R9I0_9GAMM|nr:lysozyme [Neptunomonas concharum]